MNTQISCPTDNELLKMFNNEVSVKIACSTDSELLEMRNRDSYTSYYKNLVTLEMQRRGIM